MSYALTDDQLATLGSIERNAQGVTSSPGVLTGIIPGALSGVSEGFAEMGDTLDTLVGIPLARGMDSLGGGTGWQDGFMDYRKRMRDLEAPLYTLNPAENGVVSNVLHDVFKIGTEAGTGAVMGGPMGAALVTGSAGLTSAATHAVDQNVDSGTALRIGMNEGVTRGVGVLLPAAMGESLAAKLAYGLASNTGLGVLSRQEAHDIYQAGGYDALAAEQKPFDPTALAIDTLFGLGIGGAAHYFEHRVSPSTVDAALAANNARHIETDLAPGTPKDIGALNAHVDAIEQALRETAADAPVTAHVDSSRFEPNEHVMDWMSTSDNRLSRGERKVLEFQMRDLEYKLAQFDKRPLHVAEDFLAQAKKEYPRQPSAQRQAIAARMARDANEEAKSAITDPLNRIYGILGEDKAASSKVDATTAIPQPAPASSPQPVIPEADTARRILDEMPDLHGVIGEDENGNPIYGNLRDVFDQANAEVDSAVTIETGIKAAVTCFLRG